MFDHSIINSLVRDDLISHQQIQPRFIDGFFRYWSPDHPDYVSRVSAWTKFLCQGCINSNEDDIPEALLLSAKCAVRGTDGRLYLTGAPGVVNDIHQAAMLYWKEEVSIPPNWEDFAIRVSESGTPDISSDRTRAVRDFLHRNLGPAPSTTEILGWCGSGAAANGADRVERWNFVQRPLDWDPSIFTQPYGDYDIRCVTGIAKAAGVAKNRKSSRIVAAEHPSYMFAQLGCLTALQSELDHIFGMRVPLTDATYHNRLLIDSEMSTIDLSDASDYLSVPLCRFILPPDWFALLMSCRSSYVTVPDPAIGTIPLQVMAPMGNGYCFRLLSLVVAAAVAVSADGRWSVYGDDVIVSRRSYDSTIATLQALGLRVNHAKSCCLQYVESCGLEVYQGVNITPWKPKRLRVEHGKLADIEAAINAEVRGLPSVSKATLATVQSIARYRYLRSEQSWLVRLPCWKQRYRPSVHIEGLPGLHRWLLQAERRHCERSTLSDVERCTRTSAVVIPSYTWARLETDPHAVWLNTHGVITL